MKKLFTGKVSSIILSIILAVIIFILLGELFGLGGAIGGAIAGAVGFGAIATIGGVLNKDSEEATEEKSETKK